MLKTDIDFSKLAIAAHPKVPDAIDTADRVFRYLNKLGLNPFTTKLDDIELVEKTQSGKIDLLIALGGDGTMLRAGHICGPHGIPILGINLGRFGFLMEIRQNQWEKYLPRLLNGDYWIENRMMLCANHIRNEKIIGNWEVLNEIVVGRGQYVRPVHLTASLDGHLLSTYVADALIAATATGSTAYALAVGGPVLPPELRNILLVPVAPHLSIECAIVLAEGSTVNITVETDHHASLCADGQIPIDVLNDDQVEVKASDHDVKFIRFQDPGYFYRNLTPHMSHNPSTSNQH